MLKGVLGFGEFRVWALVTKLLGCSFRSCFFPALGV